MLVTSEVSRQGYSAAIRFKGPKDRCRDERPQPDGCSETPAEAPPRGPPLLLPHLAGRGWQAQLSIEHRLCCVTDLFERICTRRDRLPRNGREASGSSLAHRTPPRPKNRTGSQDVLDPSEESWPGYRRPMVGLRSC